MTAAVATKRRPQTGAERNRRYRARRKAALAADRAIRAKQETGRWPNSPEGAFAFASELLIPTGPRQGERIHLEQFQRDFLSAIFSGDHREVGLSIARKNAKSMTAAIACLCYLAGPLNRKRWRGLVCSLTGRHAMEIREMVRQLAESSPELRAAIEVRAAPAPGYILGLNGSRLDLLASDKATGHAVGGDLVLFDELGLIEENKRPLIDALYTAMSAADGVMVAISVQGTGPFMNEMEERSKSSNRVWWRRYSALDAAAPVTNRAAWYQANPGLGEAGIKSLGYMVDASERAAAGQSENAFRALDLNLPVADERHAVVSAAAFLCCLKHDAEPPSGQSLVLGLDAGGLRSLTAITILDPDTGNMWVRCAVPDMDKPGGLEARGRRDGCGTTYRDWYDMGVLRVYGKAGVPLGAFLSDTLAELAEVNGGDMRILVAACDRYRMGSAKEALAKLGCRISWRGTGTGPTGIHDVLSFQAMVMGEAISISPRGGGEMLAFQVGQAVLRYDGNGNPAVERRAIGKIDALSATLCACGLASELKAKTDSVMVASFSAPA